MKRIAPMLTVALLMAAMLVASAAPAMAAALRPPIAGISGGGGVPVDPAVCEVLADGSAMFGWRAGGEVCWLSLPAP